MNDAERSVTNVGLWRNLALMGVCQPIGEVLEPLKH